MNYILETYLLQVKDQLIKDINEKESFLNHQQRDLKCCYISEREGRENEIKELSEDLNEYKNAMEKLDKILNPVTKLEKALA